jgi:hypothetical protein
MSSFEDFYVKKCPAGYKYYAAMLLFQYRVVNRKTGASNKKRQCSEITILLCESTSKKALRKAKQLGKNKEYDYIKTDGNKVFVEFVGITMMFEITFQTQFNETWIWFGDLLTPMEKKEKLVLSDDEIQECMTVFQKNKERLRLR